MGVKGPSEEIYDESTQGTHSVGYNSVAIHSFSCCCLPNLYHLVSHLVRLHHWRFLHYRSVTTKFQYWQPMDLADVVHEEIYLFGTDLFKLILEGVYSFDVDCTVW